MASPLRAPLTSRSVHLCVDMQRMFSADGPWPTPWMDRVLPAVAAIAERHPTRTVFTRFIPPYAPDDMPGTWKRFYRRWPNVTRSRLDPAMLELVAPLGQLVPPAVVMDKPVYSPFASATLARYLTGRSADALVVTGAETDVCVLATILGAVDNGFRVILVEDAVCSSSDTGHDALLTMFRERFTEQIEVTEAETVLSVWPKG